MTSTDRPLSPHLQVYRWRLNMLTSILHRAAGVFLSIGSIVLAGWLISVSLGAESYAEVTALLVHPIGRLLLLAWTAAFFLHLGNGLRHLCWDIGIGFEKRQYFYSGVMVFVFAIGMTAVVWYALLQKTGGLL